MRWLDPESGPNDLHPLLRHAPDDLLTATAVQPYVGNARNGGPACVEPLHAGSLFGLPSV